MTVEILSVLFVFVGGVALMRSTGVRGWPLPAVGYVAGIALQILVGSIQAITAIPDSPILTLTLTLLIPVTFWVWCYKNGRDVSIKFAPAIITLAFTIFMVVIFRYAMLTNMTVDSFYYLNIGALLESGNLESAPPFLALSRLLAVPILHAPANIGDEFYFRSVMPLLALSTLMILAWLSYESLRVTLGDIRLVQLFSFAAVCLLITNNRFLHNAFYINGHMLTAVLILLLIGCGWLLVLKTNISINALLTLQVISIPALTVTRPENSLFIGIALIPLLLSGKVPWKYRALLLAVLGFSITIWHGFLWLKYSGSEENIPVSVIGMFVIGVVSILLIPILGWRKLDKIFQYNLVLAEAGLWLTLMAFVFINPEPFRRSIIATIKNVLLDAGGWGVSLVLLGLGVVAVLIFTQVTDRVLLRFPITTFIPLAFLLVYLRDGSYRVGYGDSLNRMFLHIVPLAILLVVSATASERLGLSDWLKSKRAQVFGVNNDKKRLTKSGFL